MLFIVRTEIPMIEAISFKDFPEQGAFSVTIRALVARSVFFFIIVENCVKNW